MQVRDIKSISDVTAFCKEAGFIYQSGELYGGLSGFWDYGHLGVELKENIKRSWWNRFVRAREDVVGIDGAIITHPKVWEASGHLAGFADLLIDCKKCKARFRADVLVEDETGLQVEGLPPAQIERIIKKHKLKCEKCKGELTKPRDYNLMFKTQVGPVGGDEAYLRPETAQLIFTNFNLVRDSARMKLPFGIAQMGKGFRNEISPRDFIFRDREFEMMEIEYFVHPKELKTCPYLNKIENRKFNVLTADAQKSKLLKGKLKSMTAGQLAKKKNPWLIYWISEQYQWFIDFGIKPENLRLREHRKEELAHYATACYDIEYNFPFGWKELQGIADRGVFDLSQHAKASGKFMGVFDEEKREKIIPAVAAEPSQGVERAFLAFLIDAYTTEKVKGEERRVLKFHKDLAPIQVAVFPLLRKDKLPQRARKVFDMLKNDFITVYDEAGSIGRRYRRMDEIGCPYAITVDHQTLQDNTVTLRDRDTMAQKRVNISKLKNKLQF